MDFLKKVNTSEGRIAIVNPDKCLPNKCNQECKRGCPVNAVGKICIEVSPTDKISTINEPLCIGCGICSNQCPFGAIKIINLPKELKDILHQYGANTFRFYKLPFLKKGCVIGLLGQNGIGKSSIVSVLTGLVVPNLGHYDPLDDITIPKPKEQNQKGKRKHLSIQMDPKEQVLNYYKGTQNYQFFKDLYSGKIKAVVKLQKLDQFTQPKSILELYQKDKLNNLDKYHHLELDQIENTPINMLSGGEKQRLSIFLTLSQKANLYIFDEPTNYLDIRQRLKVAQMIRDLATSDTYVVVVDHDITILDYTTDMIHIIYGSPGAYGIVATVSNTSESINNFFDGYLPADNMRFRNQAYSYCLNLDVSSDDPELEINEDLKKQYLEYPTIKVEYPSFNLEVQGSKLPKSSTINLILGPNGSGKSSFLKGLLTESISYSYKPQYPEETFKNPKFKSLTALNLLYDVIPKSMTDSGFKSQVVDALDISGFKDHMVSTLSGGEQQKLALIVCLGKSADCYFIDEPSASLDIEERVKAMKVIKRFLVHNQKMGFVVEHDITMAFSLTKDVESKVLVFSLESQENGKRIGNGSLPMNCLDGLNIFLESIGITFRMSSFSGRYRINRIGSGRDQEQKKNKKYII